MVEEWMLHVNTYHPAFSCLHWHAECELIFTRPILFSFRTSEARCVPFFTPSLMYDRLITRILERKKPLNLKLHVYSEILEITP